MRAVVDDDDDEGILVIYTFGFTYPVLIFTSTPSFKDGSYQLRLHNELCKAWSVVLLLPFALSHSSPNDTRHMSERAVVDP